jgi:hypothetical protein
LQLCGGMKWSDFEDGYFRLFLLEIGAFEFKSDIELYFFSPIERS